MSSIPPSSSPTQPICVRSSLLDNYSSYYEAGASKWRSLGAKHKVDNIIKMCSELPHSSILEIGAGEGSVSTELAVREFSSNVHCLEISNSGVEVIKSRGVSGIKEVKLFDGYNIPYPDKTFELGIATHVLEHVEHERRFLYEAARVCNYLYVEVPLEDTLRAPYHFVADAVGHINFYNPNTLRRLLQSSGLEIIDQRLFDTPLDILMFESKTKALPKFLMRRSVFLLNKNVAARIFTCHCGVLCRGLS